MAEPEKKPRVPSSLKQIVLSYQNTCVLMAKMWLRLMAILAVALPVAFFLREETFIQALINAVGFWLLFGVVSRLLVLEFRLLRARWVARKIDRRIPAGHPFRQTVIDWIIEKNDGNFLNTLLKKLGAAPHSPALHGTPQAELSSAPYDPTAFINGVLEKLGKQVQQASQSHVYTSSHTAVLNGDGEWVIVESSTSEDGDGIPPEAAIQQAIDQAEPPEGFKPIPISGTNENTADVKKTKKRRRRRSKHMPLEIESFQPEGNQEATSVGEEGGDRG